MWKDFVRKCTEVLGGRTMVLRRSRINFGWVPGDGRASALTGLSPIFTLVATI